MPKNSKKVQEAVQVLKELGLPSNVVNERTAICLLALLNITLRKDWHSAEDPLIGIRGILDFARNSYKVNYAENTRETIRDESIKYLAMAGLIIENPDKPDRSKNSPNYCYQISSEALALFRSYKTSSWSKQLASFRKGEINLVESFAKTRDMHRVPLKLKDGKEISLSAGEHSKLIKSIIEDFAERFVPSGELIYVGDTQSKWGGYFNKELLESLGINVKTDSKMPDVLIYYRQKNWLIIVEAVSSNGPVDNLRHSELSKLFEKSTAGLVFITAFPDRGKTLKKFLLQLAWETDVWCASDPTHLIHFDGLKFLGPY